MVRVLFIHPEKGLQDIGVKNGTIEEVRTKLEELGCAILTIEVEKE